MPDAPATEPEIPPFPALQEAHAAPTGFFDRYLPAWRKPAGSFRPMYVLLQFGNPARPEGWIEIGIVVFGSDGRTVAAEVDGIELLTAEMAQLREMQAAGYRLKFSRERQLRIEVAKFIETLTDLGTLDVARAHPLHLYQDGLHVIRVGDPVNVEDNARLSQKWRELVMGCAE